MNELDGLKCVLLVAAGAAITGIGYGTLSVYVTGTLYWLGVVSHDTVINVAHWCASVGFVYGGIGATKDFVIPSRMLPYHSRKL